MINHPLLQGAVSAGQYHHSCKELLGDNFNCIFNELLVLLPDISKQQELLTAHRDFKAAEKTSDTGRKSKNKKNKANQGAPTAANSAAELDCQVCPTCTQVLTPKDFNSHKSLHMRDNEEFPSLQSISRICRWVRQRPRVVRLWGLGRAARLPSEFWGFVKYQITFKWEGGFLEMEPAARFTWGVMQFMSAPWQLQIILRHLEQIRLFVLFFNLLTKEVLKCISIHAFFSLYNRKKEQFVSIPEYMISQIGLLISLNK